MSEKHEPINLATVGDGAAVELFEQELERVLENVLDPNTEAETTRKIRIDITLKPNDQREVGAFVVEASSKLAPFKGRGTNVFIGVLNGTPTCVEANPKQIQMDWDAESKPTAIRGGADDGMGEA